MLVGAPIALLALVGALAISSSGSSEKPAPSASSAGEASAAPSAAPAPAPEKASAEELAKAAEEGAAAFDALAGKYPKDGAVFLARGSVDLKDKEPGRAVTDVARALELEPTLAGDERAATILWMTAQNRKSSEATLRLLAGAMGEKGRSILSDLASTPNVRQGVRDEAKRTLAEAQKP